MCAAIAVFIDGKSREKGTKTTRISDVITWAWERERRPCLPSRTGGDDLTVTALEAWVLMVVRPSVGTKKNLININFREQRLRVISECSGYGGVNEA